MSDNEIGIITGTRPGIIMMAPVVKELQRRGHPFFVIHSSQHYSPNMDSMFFSDLDLPQPDYRLEGIQEHKTHGAQTGAMLAGIERILIERRPAVMLVYGDTNSNLSAALAARKLHIPIAHVEAGERGYDWNKPEEHNRKMIDVISEYLLVTGEKAKGYLLKEGIPESRIFVTGNPIVDVAVKGMERAKKESKILETLNLAPGNYGLITLHREENTEYKEKLVAALEGASQAAVNIGMDEVIFLAHPRTQDRIRRYGLEDWLKALPAIRVIEPLAYLDFMKLLSGARLAFTDSGGISQETVIHGIPAVILVERTEWIEGIELGAHVLAGCHKDKIIAGAELLKDRRGQDWGWPFGKPSCSARICDVLIDRAVGAHKKHAA